MNSFVTSTGGRVLIVRLGKGDLLLESIICELERAGIKNAVMLSAIGSLRKTVFHIITTTNDLPSDKFITMEGPMEIGAIQGLVLDGQPHFHIVCSDIKRTYTGHLESGCEVQYLAEISLIELTDTGLTRKADNNGISYIIPALDS